MQWRELLEGLRSGRLSFSDVLAYIDAHYHYAPTRFCNGGVENAAGSNEGSCRVLAFARLQQLAEVDALLLFAEHYRKVLASPEGTDHGNIRAFMQHGWAGVAFDAEPLRLKGQ